MSRPSMWFGSVVVLAAGFILCGLVLAQDDTSKGPVVDFAGLKSSVPRAWKEDTRTFEKETYKRYQLDAVEDNKYNAHVTLNRLDKTKGDDAADMVKYWQSKFLQPNGKTVADVTKVEKKKVGKLEYTIVDITGTWKGFVNEPDTAYPHFRLLGVCATGPDGFYSARLVGPTVAVEYYRGGFETWVQGLK